MTEATPTFTRRAGLKALGAMFLTRALPAALTAAPAALAFTGTLSFPSSALAGRTDPGGADGNGDGNADSGCSGGCGGNDGNNGGDTSSKDGGSHEPTSSEDLCAVWFDPIKDAKDNYLVRVERWRRGHENERVIDTYNQPVKLTDEQFAAMYREAMTVRAAGFLGMGRDERKVLRLARAETDLSDPQFIGRACTPKLMTVLQKYGAEIVFDPKALAPAAQKTDKKGKTRRALFTGGNGLY